MILDCVILLNVFRVTYLRVFEFRYDSGMVIARRRRHVIFRLTFASVSCGLALIPEFYRP